jgi:hypothetical protein
VLGFHTVTGTHCSIEPITDATVNFYLGDLANGASAPFELDTNYLLNIEATLDPTNTFSLGQITRNKKKGTATIDLTLPNSGDLTGSGNGVNAASARQAVTSKSVGAGQAQLLIKAKGKKKKQLNQKGKVKLNVTITYTPTSGSASTQSVPVKLKKKHGRTSEQEKTPRIAGLL